MEDRCEQVAVVLHPTEGKGLLISSMNRLDSYSPLGYSLCGVVEVGRYRGVRHRSGCRGS